MFSFCWLGCGGMFFLLQFGRRRVYFLDVCARGRVYFYAVWAGSVFFSAVWAGTGVHSLTGLPGTSVRSPTRKKTKQPNKNTGSHVKALGDSAQ